MGQSPPEKGWPCKRCAECLFVLATAQFVSNVLRDSVGQQGFCDLVADAHDRVEGGHRFLESHGDARAAKLAQLIGR